MNAKLNHIGIATQDPERSAKLFKLLGIHKTNSEEVALEKVITHFFPVSGPTSLEFLEPTQSDSTIAAFIAKKGEGIHHLSFEVKTGELDSLMTLLKSEGFQLIYDHPRSGAHDMRINFIHPKTTGGILVEIMEKAADKKS